MSQVSVNIVDPAAGAQIPMTGGGGSSAPLQENRRQFDQSQQQQQGQFEVSAQQQQQQLDMQRQQMEAQKKADKHNRHLALIEQAMMAQREKLAFERERVQEEIRNATMAGDLTILEKRYPELDELENELDRVGTQAAKLSMMDLYVKNVAMGGTGPDGQQEAPLIQKDLAEAMELSMEEDFRREQQILESLEQAISGNTNPDTDPSARPEGEEPGVWERLKDPSGMKEGRRGLPAVGDMADTKTIPGLTADKLMNEGFRGPVIFSDDLVMRVAPQLGMGPEETDLFRSMVQSLENAATHNAMGSPESRDGELAKAQRAADALVQAGVEPDKMGLVLKGLTRLGAESRLSMQRNAAERNAANVQAGEKDGLVQISPKDKAYFTKVEQMGVLGSSLRGADGKPLFNNTTSVRVEKLPDGKTKLSRGGVNPADILPEVTADFLDNGKFDNRAKYLEQLPPGLRAKVEKVLVNRQAALQNEMRAQGLDPETLDLRKELETTKGKEKELKRKKDRLMNDVTLERARSQLKTESEGAARRKSAEEELLNPLTDRLNKMFDDFGGE